MLAKFRLHYRCKRAKRKLACKFPGECSLFSLSLRCKDSAREEENKMNLFVFSSLLYYFCRLLKVNILWKSPNPTWNRLLGC